MRCPACNFSDTKVSDSRVVNEGLAIRRRRKCLKCGFRFSTYEEVEILNLNVKKRSGRIELYSRDKLEAGIKKALEKRPLSQEDFKKIIHNIERDIQVIDKGEISTKQIGEIVMKYLKKIDHVAYLRFASVYRSFDNVETFHQEIDQLLKKKK